MRRNLLRVAAVAACVTVVGAVEWRRPPAARWSTRAAVAGIHVYQATLSPLYGRMGVQCRFTPTCSHYGEAVIGQFGVVRGGWMATTRVLRCGPWTPAGTTDLPPTGTPAAPDQGA